MTGKITNGNEPSILPLQTTEYAVGSDFDEWSVFERSVEMSNKVGLATQWKPGQSGNPKGRPVGSRNLLGEKFVQTLYEHFLEHGPKAIERVFQLKARCLSQSDCFNPAEGDAF